MADGDSIYALSVGNVVADINAVGTLSAYVMAKAIASGVRAAKDACGLLSASDLDQSKTER